MWRKSRLVWGSSASSGGSTVPPPIVHHCPLKPTVCSEFWDRLFLCLHQVESFSAAFSEFFPRTSLLRWKPRHLKQKAGTPAFSPPLPRAQSISGYQPWPLPQLRSHRGRDGHYFREQNLQKSQPPPTLCIFVLFRNNLAIIKIHLYMYISFKLQKYSINSQIYS